jgi:tetratricopeptide (TPR) repeat protein
MAHRSRRRSGPGRIAFLVLCILAVLYIDRFVIPSSTAFFEPTPTPTQSPESFANQAQELFTAGKLRPAIEAYQQAIRTNPENRSYYVEMARIQVWVGLCKEAQESAERALVGNDGYALAHAVRGWALNCLEDYLQAEGAVSTALELDPNNALAHAYQAEILINKHSSNQGSLGDLDKAIEESRIAYSLAPNLLEALRARGYVLWQTGNHEESIDMYKAALNINKNISDLYLQLGYNYKALELNTEAAEYFERANALNPSDPIPDLELSRVYGQVGDFGKAVQYAENAVKDDPENAFRYGNLGMWYYKNEELDKAIDVLKLVIEGGTSGDGVVVEGVPLDYGWMASYYTYYGLALARVSPNRCSEAVPVFQALIEGVPEDAISQENAIYGLDLCGEKIDEPEATPMP